MRAEALPGSFWPNDRQKLLLRAALLGGEESVRAWQQLQPTFDLDGLEPSSYALLPLVHRQLARAEFEDPLLPRLRGMYRRAWYLNRLLLGRLMEPLEEVQATGGEPIVVSSWELPARYYGDFGLRRVDALRVLVRPERVDDAARALVDSGWDSRLQGSNAPLRSRRPTRFRKGGDECFLYLRLFHEFCEPKR